MSGRSGRLARLLTIRRLSENMERRELALALAAVAEVEMALGQQQTALTDARLGTRTALEAAQRGEWLLAEAQGEVAGWNRRRLGELLRVRAQAVAPAMEKFVRSRREHEQVKQLVEDARRADGIEQDRKAQAATDDWFLSRLGRETE